MDNKNTIIELEALKNELLEKVRQIDQTINTLRAFSSIGVGNGSPQLPSSNGNGYDKTASVKTKFKYVLKKEGKFLPIRKISEILHSYEPAIPAKDWVSKLYPAISELKKAGTIVKVSVGESNVNTFWGSKNWVDSAGNPKAAHKYDEDLVKKFGTEDTDI